MNRIAYGSNQWRVAAWNSDLVDVSVFSTDSWSSDFGISQEVLADGAKPPRKTQDDRLVEPEQLGLKCLYEPPKTSAGKTTGVDVEYAIYSYSFVID